MADYSRPPLVTKSAAFLRAPVPEAALGVSGGPALVLGRGENPINVVSIHDVAAVVEHCLVDPTTVRQAIDVADRDGCCPPCLVHGDEVIANEVANRVVPWLGTRFVGLFCVSQRPLNG